MPEKRNAFISYRHKTHAGVKRELINLNDRYGLFIDFSIDSEDISDSLPDETIRRKIRDMKLKNSSVTLFIHGNGTDKRKFIDWELAGSMIDYTGGNRSAIVIIDTLGFSMSDRNTNMIDVSDDFTNMKSIPEESYSSETFWKAKLPGAPERLIKNFIKKDVNINVISWETVKTNPLKLKNLIDKVALDRGKNNYNTSIPLKKGNY